MKLNEVKKEVISAFFDRYNDKKSTTDYAKNFMEEQPALSMLGGLLLDEFISQIKQANNKKEIENMVKIQMFGLMTTMYALLKEQQEIDELEELYA